MMQRERMAGRALLTIGRHDAELAERLASLLEYAESLGENIVYFSVYSRCFTSRINSTSRRA